MPDAAGNRDGARGGGKSQPAASACRTPGDRPLGTAVAEAGVGSQFLQTRLLNLGPPPGVDRLVVIADDVQVVLRCREETNQPKLGGIHVLELVDADVAEARLPSRRRRASVASRSQERTTRSSKSTAPRMRRRSAYASRTGRASSGGGRLSIFHADSQVSSCAASGNVAAGEPASTRRRRRRDVRREGDRADRARFRGRLPRPHRLRFG